MTSICFIINPISGKGKNTIAPECISRYFPALKYQVTITYSLYKGHAKELALIALEKQTDIIVACGGDGTINEVASCLVHTRAVLGIIPIGSGNGLASNLGLSKEIETALACIANQQTTIIDVGMVNGTAFFSNIGFGFDATVIQAYEQLKKRNLSGYVLAFFKALFMHSYKQITITTKDNTQRVTPFMLFVSNSNQMGYDVSLTPKASLQDGVLDMVLIPKTNYLKLAYLFLLVLFKKYHWIKNIEYKTITHLSITQKQASDFLIQQDGEHRLIKGNALEISIAPKALQVIVNS